MIESAGDFYQQTLLKKLDAALNQKEKIQFASNWVAKSIESKGWVYAFGTGHSHSLAEEIFYRAGGFARVRPILDSRLMLHENASQSTEIERTEGITSELLGKYVLSEYDVMILVSNSGRNAVPIDMALEAKKAGAKTICLTNMSHSSQVKSRHSSGKRLFEVCDLTLDNFGELGDASTSVPGLNSKMGATSTIIGSAILHTIMIESASILTCAGHKPEVFHSSNTDLGEEVNSTLIKKYSTQIKEL